MHRIGVPKSDLVVFRWKLFRCELFGGGLRFLRFGFRRRFVLDRNFRR